MNIADLFAQERIIFVGHATDKVRLIKGLAAAIAPAAGVAVEALAAALLRREELGSTGLGNGVALPHARLPEVRRPIALVAILESPMDFDAIDGLPVGLVCMIVLPDNAEALAALSTISRALRREGLVSQLRKSSSPADAYDLLVGNDVG